MGFPADQVWKADDAPANFRKMLMKAILGLEITITRVEGKGKFGQEIRSGDQMGCICGFEAMGTNKGQQMGRDIVKSMEKDSKRVGVLEKESG